MFCPKCGSANQEENSYCRSCGIFLPDFDKLKSRETSPETHFTANYTLNIMTAAACLGLAITLYAIFLGRDDTPVIIYITAGFLTAMFFWQVQVFWRTMQLKKQFPKRRKEENVISADKEIEPVETNKLLEPADFSDVVPASVTENTTKNLARSQAELSQTKQ